MHWQQLSRRDPVCVLRTLCTIFCGDCTSLYSHLQCAMLFLSCIHSSVSVLSLCHWYMSSGSLTRQGLLSTLSYISFLFFPFLEPATLPSLALALLLPQAPQWAQHLSVSLMTEVPPVVRWNLNAILICIYLPDG